MARDTDGLPADLPPGRLVAPDAEFAPDADPSRPVVWVSDAPLPEDEAGRWWRALHRDVAERGRWPLLLGGLDVGGGAPLRPWRSGELAPAQPAALDEVRVEELLAAGWERFVEEAGEAAEEADEEDDEEDKKEVDAEDAEDAAEFDPPYPSWPGPAPAGKEGADPDEHVDDLVQDSAGVAALLRGSGRAPFLGIVGAVDGADAVARVGWEAEEVECAELAAVVQQWQQRFGARLVSLGFDTVGLAVARPPHTAEHARRVAAEHFAFCPDLAQEHAFEEYAEALRGAQVWSFWWD